MSRLKAEEVEPRGVKQPHLSVGSEPICPTRFPLASLITRPNPGRRSSERVSSGKRLFKCCLPSQKELGNDKRDGVLNCTEIVLHAYRAIK